MVMTFGPVMGVTKNRLLQFAPPGLLILLFNIMLIFYCLSDELVYFSCVPPEIR